ncbi:hypothetical protein J4458_02685 [Candidatus Woesearchaeota archaeon]|nr:hypothetical protein [Candidatus Woesearchaeota archaeon]
MAVKQEGKAVRAAEPVLKNLTFGVEFEAFTLDSKGYMASGSEKLIKRVKETNQNIAIVKECGQNMLEINSFPHTNIQNNMLKVIEDFEAVLHCAEKDGLAIYAYGTYPGSFKPEMRQDKRYAIQEQILGKTRFLHAARCVGLHCHCSLPWGVFDSKLRIIKNLVNSKNKQCMVNTYNLFIAIDPALTTFAQSSPFYQGKFLGKDSRVIVYRGGDALKYPHGLYTNYPDFGMLQPYKSTGTDLLQIISKRFDSWSSILKNLDVNLKVLLKHGSILDTTWNPIKISSHGTIEQRGMDMNHPSIVVAIATAVKYISKELQDKFVQVMPSDIGVTEPFKREGNVIHIPPHTHIRFELQPKSAYKGLEDNAVYAYCSGILKLAKSCIPKDRLVLIEPLGRMLKERKTVSDHILSQAKKMGIDIKKVTNKQAAELALRYSRELFKDIILTKQVLKSLSSDL